MDPFRRPAAPLSSCRLIAVVAIWAVLVSGGILWVWHYKITPGVAGPERLVRVRSEAAS